MTCWIRRARRVATDRRAIRGYPTDPSPLDRRGSDETATRRGTRTRRHDRRKTTMADANLLDESSGIRYSYDNIKTQGYLEGHEAGLDQVVSWLQDRAVALFRDEKDDQAVALRRLAKDLDRELRPVMREHATRHERDFPDAVQDEDR
jgi:hypothetical protein